MNDKYLYYKLLVQDIEDSERMNNTIIKHIYTYKHIYVYRLRDI